MFPGGIVKQINLTLDVVEAKMNFWFSDAIYSRFFRCL